MLLKPYRCRSRGKDIYCWIQESKWKAVDCIFRIKSLMKMPCWKLFLLLQILLKRV